MLSFILGCKMRFLDVHTLGFKELNIRISDGVRTIYRHPDPSSDYAILSHRWADGQEVSFQELSLIIESEKYPEDITRSVAARLRDIKARSGFRKILDFCHVAKGSGFHLAWIDTCCINKESSAELQEAINSMWAWYSQARVCFVHLQDVRANRATGNTSWMEEMASSVWFTRGWTLQEILAPRHLIFYNMSWKKLGELKKRSDWRSIEDQELCRHLLGITRISEEPLLCGDLSDASVAQKMSWAAHRTTTRDEDVAYCLLGLFGINMPLIYGEGRTAFIRLQKEMLQQDDDESIFAWNLDFHMPRGVDVRLSEGILAHHPFAFKDAGDIVLRLIGVPLNLEHLERPDIPYTITNRSLHLQRLSIELPPPPRLGAFVHYAVALSCYSVRNADSLFLVLAARRSQSHLYHDNSIDIAGCYGSLRRHGEDMLGSDGQSWKLRRFFIPLQ